jgi:hypothetical protein
MIETDYLVVGGGAAGLAFTDALVADSDADVVIVDRRHRPGGHWNDAYPFVRLHQPAAFYGVNSRVLGSDTIDAAGRNAGGYERVTAAEILEYFDHVLAALVSTGRVRFFGLCDYDFAGGDTHRFVSRLTGEETEVAVRRKLVDGTYLETSVPSTHTPSFGVDDGVHMIPVNGLVKLADGGSGFTIIGAGKTAMDACIWLVDEGVDPDRIRWIRPRDCWMLNRDYMQPLDLVGRMLEGVARNLECAAEAESVADLFRRLEASEQLLRVDESVEPTMYRCATVNRSEIETLRSIEHVVRRGHVRSIGSTSIEMDQGPVPTDARQIHVDCTADGLHIGPGRPIFAGDTITLQQVRTCQPTYNAALVGFVEAVKGDDATKNGLCPYNPYPTLATDWIRGTAVSQASEVATMSDPEVGPWREASRLNAARGVADHLDDPAVVSAVGRFSAFSDPAIENLRRLEATLRDA